MDLKISGSIISKKGAESLSALVLDVKFGRSALFKDLKSAKELAQLLVSTLKTPVKLCSTTTFNDKYDVIGARWQCSYPGYFEDAQMQQPSLFRTMISTNLCLKLKIRLM